ncbi:alpha/beta hydrolase [Burkholderia ubonensis]|uniref:alpha/beta hydrolase n=1 Tax=Burkholderia ubonensis TaxID=101571 RepID=UPI001453D16B|nr:alpha/beta hydrolase [Burkholderia ubonensis]VWB77788.1 alpha/beta hydrolase [Burkholderia ubonensis]
MIEPVLQLEKQMPLPTASAEAYAETVLRWAREIPADAGLRNIAYGPHRRHTYDVFYPHDAAGAPVVIFWHGGGWTNGHKEYGWFMAEHVTRLGAVLVLPNYRLAPESRMPAALDDCTQLLRALAESRTFAGDMRNVYVAGHSAGGHLAALTALRANSRRVNPDDAWSIRGCAPISGIMDISHPAPAPGSLEARVYDMVLERADDDGVCSPACWAAGNAIPFALHYGERDSPRVIRSNRRLAALLACQSAPVSCHVATRLDHFDTHLALRDPDCQWYESLNALIGGRPQ